MDSTQLKRAAIVGTGALAVVATGGEDLAARVTTENLGRGTERMGDAERKGINDMADAATPAALHLAWKDARVSIRHQADVEKALGRKKTALEIRDFLSGEFEPVPLADVLAVLRAREASGQIRFVAKPR